MAGGKLVLHPTAAYHKLDLTCLIPINKPNLASEHLRNEGRKQTQLFQIKLNIVFGVLLMHTLMRKCVGAKNTTSSCLSRSGSQICPQTTLTALIPCLLSGVCLLRSGNPHTLCVHVNIPQSKSPQRICVYKHNCFPPTCGSRHSFSRRRHAGLSESAGKSQNTF